MNPISHRLWRLKRSVLKSRFVLQDCLFNTYVGQQIFKGPFFERSTNISHENKLIFVHNPKCAGKSIRKLLGLPSQVDHRPPTSLVRKAAWEAYTSVVVVRNPFDRLVSSWAYHTSEGYAGVFFVKYPKLRSLSLEEYFELMKHEENVIRPQVEYVSHAFSEKTADHILRFEHLEEDVDFLCKAIGVPNNLPHLNRSAHVEHRKCFTKSLRAKVELFYEQDQLQFDYSF